MIRVLKLTGTELLRLACESTMHGKKSGMTLKQIYQCEHSPIRTQLFWVEMHIPTFVSVHFVRHKIGVEHFVETNRDDRGGVEADRWTPVKHSMLINAQALIQMARKRLCRKAHPTTRQVMADLRFAVQEVDPDLFEHMVPECVYRGKCNEIHPCYEKE